MKKFFTIIFLSFLFSFCFAESIFVCLGSFRNSENAQRLVQNLNDLGEEAFIYETVVNNQTMFRVLYSKDFDQKDEARTFRDSIKDADFVKNLNLSGLWICEAQKPVVEPLPVVQNVVPEPLPETVLLEKNEETIPVSEEKPYSVLVHSYKEEQSAENGKNRLKEHEIDSYVLKTFDEDSYFSFDLHSGAFESEEETEPLQQKLEEIGITDTKISDFADEKEKIQKYNEVLKSQDVTFDNGKTEIPEIYSPAVLQLIKEFPINKNFSLENLSIFDFDNLRASDEDLPDLDDFYDLIADSQKVHAASYATYNDELFDKNVVIYISSGDENTFYELQEIKDSLSQSEEANEFEIKDADFLVKGEILKSLIIQDDTESLFYGVNENKSLAIFMLTEDFTPSQFDEFINNFDNDSSLLIYPQIRRTLLVLPENTDVQRDFLMFNLSKVQDSYAEEKGYADWSFPIVGHWNASATFSQEDEDISVSFFDLDYDYNAKRVHEMFMDDHITNDYSHSSTVQNAPSWYVSIWTGNEVSFSTKSYIISINSYYFEEESLVDLADELLIWEE